MQVTLSSLRRWASTIKFKIVLMVIGTSVLSALGTAGLVLATSQQRMEAMLLDNAADDRERTAAMLSSKVSLLKDALSIAAKATPAAFQRPKAGWRVCRLRALRGERDEPAFTR